MDASVKMKRVSVWGVRGREEPKGSSKPVIPNFGTVRLRLENERI